MEKKFEFAVKWIEHLNNKESKVRYTLIVAGNPITDIQCDYIEYLGEVNYGYEMHEQYTKADFTIIPSHSESCSLCMLESMASGTPVIVNDIIGLKEYILNTKTGYVISIDDINSWTSILMNLIDNDRLYTNISVTARKYIRNNHTIDAMINEYYKCWCKFL